MDGPDLDCVGNAGAEGGPLFCEISGMDGPDFELEGGAGIEGGPDDDEGGDAEGKEGGEGDDCSCDLQAYSSSDRQKTVTRRLIGCMLLSIGSFHGEYCHRVNLKFN